MDEPGLWFWQHHTSLSTDSCWDGGRERERERERGETSGQVEMNSWNYSLTTFLLLSLSFSLFLCLYGHSERCWENTALCFPLMSCSHTVIRGHLSLDGKGTVLHAFTGNIKITVDTQKDKGDYWLCSREPLSSTQLEKLTSFYESNATALN